MMPLIDLCFILLNADEIMLMVDCMVFPKSKMIFLLDKEACCVPMVNSISSSLTEFYQVPMW